MILKIYVGANVFKRNVSFSAFGIPTFFNPKFKCNIFTYRMFECHSGWFRANHYSSVSYVWDDDTYGGIEVSDQFKKNTDWE